MINFKRFSFFRFLFLRNEGGKLWEGMDFRRSLFKCLWKGRILY